MPISCLDAECISFGDPKHELASLGGDTLAGQVFCSEHLLPVAAILKNVKIYYRKSVHTCMACTTNMGEDVECEGISCKGFRKSVRK